MTGAELLAHRADLRARLASPLVGRARVDALNALAFVERDFDGARSLELCEEARDLAVQADVTGTPYVAGVIEALRTRSLVSAFRGQNHQALADLQEALELLKAEPNCEIQLQLHCVLPSVLVGLGRLDEASEIAFTTLDQAATMSSPLMRSFAHDALCGVSAAVGNWPDALEHCLEAQACAQAANSFRECTFLLNNLAWLHNRVGDQRRALDEVTRCLELASDVGFKTLEVVALGTQTEILLEMGDRRAAIAACEVVLDRAERRELRQEQVVTCRLLGGLHLRGGNLDLAVRTIRRALDLATEFGLPLEQSACHELLAQALEQCGDFQNALAHWREFRALSDEVLLGPARLLERQELKRRLRRVQSALDAAHQQADELKAEIHAHRSDREELLVLASRDSLTGAFNRRHLTEVTTDYLRRRGDSEGVVLILFDLDQFKAINDTYGHTAGDLALQTIVRRAKASLRQGDWLGRVGGDEFVAVLPDTMGAVGFAVADRIRRAIASEIVALQTQQIRVSVSAGLAYLPGGAHGTLTDLIEAADEALYESKRRGGNQTVLHERAMPRDQRRPERADRMGE